MKQRTNKILALLMALVMALSAVVPALALEPFAYDGDELCFITADGAAFGMLSPQEGSSCVINGDNVVIHVVPNNKTVYNAIHWGAIDDEELTRDLPFNDDGTFDITLPKSNCGTAIPVAPVKVKDGATTSKQYYLAIPAEDKLEDVTPVEPFAYDGDVVNFINVDGGQFGMFAAQDGTTCVIDGDNVVIHYVPKNTTVYGWIHFGGIADKELTKDVVANDDGSYDITLGKDRCGWAIPVAPVKVKDGATTSTQYYLAIPAEDKLEDVTPVEPFPYDGDVVNFINVDGGQFGMFTAQEGTTCAIDGDNVVIHYVPKNTTVYNAIHFGGIADKELTKDVTANDDGSYDITLSKDNCGWAIPVAPVKAKDGATTSTQYYLAIPAEDKLEPVTPVEPEPQPEPEPETTVEPFPYDGDAVNFINVDGGQFGMFTAQDGTTCAIDGDNVVIHYVPKNTTVYGWIHFGGIADSELTKDVTANDDGSFDITLSKDNCGWAIPVAPVKVKDGATTSTQYYLAIPAEDKLEPVTPVEPEPQPEPEPEPQPEPQPEPEPAPADERVDLEIVNTTGMFKGLYAYVLTENGQSTLVVALTGKTYHNLYKGTYAQALANGDNRDNWIAGQQDADGKWFFSFPLAEGETYLPVVSISQTYLDKYESGENPLERSFFPRQFVLDLTAKTLTVGDYDETVTVTVVNNAQGVQVADTAQMRVVGGPNSNNFRVAPVLQMLDDTFDQMTFPTVEGGKLTTATAALSADKTFAVDMLNAPNLFAFRDKEPVELQLRVKATGETVTVTMTVDLLAQTITLAGGETAAETGEYVFVAGGDSTWTRGGGDLLLTVKRTVDDETTFSRFTGVTVDGQTLAAENYTAVAGSVNVTLKAAYLETLAAGSHDVAVTFDDASASTTLTVAEAESAEPGDGATAPDTGDGSLTLILLAALALAAAAGLVILPARRKEA